MAGKQVTFKPTDEVVDRFEKLFENAKAENPLLSKPKFFEMLVNGYGQQPESENHIEDLNIAKLHKSLSEKYEKFYFDLCDLLNISRTDTIFEDVISEIRATQQRAMMALQTQEIPEDYQRPLAENEILFSIPDIHLKLLQEVTRRLSSPENTVTIKDILLDMFLRYEVQRYNEWFYPFVISDDEFLQITGYTRKQLKKVCQE